jgi:pyruvate formate lyase activating enzyme
MKHAAYYQSMNNHRVQCNLCPHHCRMRPGQSGFCLTRQNVDGTLVSANFCRPLSLTVDPIEKKPLYHFYPGASIFSTGPNGCTFKCSFCQNSEISQELLTAREVTPRWLADKVVASGSIGIAYTYSEPMMELGPLVKDKGLKNVMVTNGFVEPAPLRDLLTIVHAMNIDIKSMNPAFYRRICKGSLAPVLATCETVKRAGCHLEITHLLIPGENDDSKETEALALFIAEHLGKDTPLHLSRYFPRYRMSHPATPEPILFRAYETAKQHLDYVYVGNIALPEKENTFCPDCGTMLIKRSGYHTMITTSLAAPAAPQGKPSCKECGREIAILLER